MEKTPETKKLSELSDTDIIGLNVSIDFGSGKSEHDIKKITVAEYKRYLMNIIDSTTVSNFKRKLNGEVVMNDGYYSL